VDQATADRLNVKHPENTLHQKLCDEVGLCPAQADKALEIFLEHARINYDESRPPGQILRTVVSATEPAGKPIKHCQTLQVRLTVDHRLDAEILRLHGTVALRRAKVLRLCWEAYEQGGLLSYEDLASILGLDQSSIQRMVKALRLVVGLVPTRGVMHDMGRAPSHKEHIGRLLCRGYSYTEITAMTGHTEASIDRYALDLGRVIALARQGAAPNDIRVICELSETAVDCYLRLYREHDADEFRQHIDRLTRRFESGKGITEDAGATLTHKEVICDLRDAGYTPAEISVITCHAPHSRDRYLKTDLRVETLIKVLEAIPDDVQAARFLGIQRSVVAQYLRRWRAKQHGHQPAAAQAPRHRPTAAASP
jgi:predicted transcriptional regulator